MNLFYKTATISAIMISLCSLPFFFTQVKKFAHYLFLVGTGALVGICIFDLIPDVFEMGGFWSITLVTGVWLGYSLIHLLQHRHHSKHYHDPLHSHEQGIAVFLVSMILHCISSGILLATSTELDSNFGRTVFFALIAHKCYEALIVSSIILERVQKRAHIFLYVTIYALALPLGVAITLWVGEGLSLKYALYIACFSLGTLLGCTVFDFLLPSLSHVKNKRVEATWIVLGLVLTEAMMKLGIH